MTIIILPRVISLTISGLVVTENKIAPITEDEIMVNHYYLRHARGIFIVVKGPINPLLFSGPGPLYKARPEIVPSILEFQ